MKVTTKVGNLEYKVHKSKLNLVSNVLKVMKCSGIAKRWDTKTQQKKYQLKLEEIHSYSIHFKKRFIFSERRKLFFVLKRNPFFFLLGAPLGTFGSKGLHPEIDFWVNSVSFAVHQPKQKAKKNHMQISYVVLLYKGHHSIFGEKNMANQNKSNQFTQKIHLFLRAPKTNGAPTVLEFSFPRFSEILCTS